MPTPYQPRLSVVITEEQQKFLRDTIPHGLQKPLFQAIINNLMTQTSDQMLRVLNLVLADKLTVLDLLGGGDG